MKQFSTICWEHLGPPGSTLNGQSFPVIPWPKNSRRPLGSTSIAGSLQAEVSLEVSKQQPSETPAKNCKIFTLWEYKEQGPGWEFVRQGPADVGILNVGILKSYLTIPYLFFVR